MANIDLIFEKTGRKVTVNEAVSEFYTKRGWVETPTAAPVDDEAAKAEPDAAAEAAATAEAEAKEAADAKEKARSDNADSDTGESAAPAGKTTKRGASSSS